MAQIIVNFSINEDVKSKMESACKEMGLSLSTAFNIFAVKVGNERRIPF
jgi:DNA-damage-inducible protein J